MAYKEFGFVVDSCPTSKAESNEAANRLRCSVDDYGRSLYVCVPNEELSANVEFCYTKSIVALYQNGTCLKTIQNGVLDQISCKNFTEGCPTEFYRSSDLYKYPACSNLNTQDRCFLAVPSCKSSYSNTSTAGSHEESAKLATILGVVMPLLVLVGILIAFLFWRRRQIIKSYRGFRANEDRNDLEQKELLQVQEKTLNEKTSDETNQFSTLTDDEVSVLFCFLCSDSGPPDFTDTEWLDMLNEIRRRVYHYKQNPVTSEEAQQTLDGLKSRNLLWMDQTKKHLTEDAKHVTLQRVSNNRVFLNANLFHLSSFFTAQRYLIRKIHKWSQELMSNNSKSGIRYNGVLDTLLINRLQMNILTHVIVKEKLIYDNVSKILNVPLRIVSGSNQDRTDFQEKLKKAGERIQCTKASRDNVDHVTWLWRYEEDARPDIVRSCIGLHPHWDIYIIDNKAYRKPSKYNTYQPDIRCLLYCVLLVDNYFFDVNLQAHKVLMSELSERYFTNVHSRDKINLTGFQEESVIKEGNTFRFKSDDIRHDVMYAFITECLVEDSDLEFFLTTASHYVISEYCRSWMYARSEGERCLYVPDRPQKMYDLFIDKLKLDIITHCTLSDEGIHDGIHKR